MGHGAQYTVVSNSASSASTHSASSTIFPELTNSPMAIEASGSAARQVALIVVAWLGRRETKQMGEVIEEDTDMRGQTRTDQAFAYMGFLGQALAVLVGKVPLKGMVRDATDKVERMCIEARCA